MSPPLRILLLGRRAEELWNTVAEAFPCGAIRSATMSSDSTVSAECARSRPDLVILDATVPHGRAFVDTLLKKRLAEEALRESQSRFFEIIEAAPDAILGADSGGRITLANAQAETMFGYSRGALLGRPVETLIPERFRDRHVHHREAYAADPYARSMGMNLELAGLRKDGREFPIEVSLAPFISETGLQVLGTVRDVTERKQMEQALREAEADYRGIFENAVEGIYRSIPGGGFLSVNPAAVHILGYASAEELKQEVTDIGKQLFVDAGRRAEYVRLLESEGIVRALEVQMRRRDGSPIWVSCTARAVRDSSGAIRFHEGTMEDITQRVELQERFLHSQKMEAIGQLAGGIAHDFNNMLTVIVGYTSMLLSHLGGEERHRQHLEEIQRAADRSAGLTRQLLAFSRRQIMQPVVLNLNTAVSNMDKMLRRIIGEDIRVQTTLAENLGNVKVDPGQIEQVIMNLVINARDAMPESGHLNIETENVELGQADAHNHVEVEPGAYVLLAISDSGVGMDAATRARIFEPFFTTKGPEKGTGLGLSTVYGIVKQSGGHIWVYSEPGHGTTFKICFPRIREPVRAAPAPDLPPHSAGDETILLVEDDAAVRSLAKMVLEMYRYIVLEAGSGAETISIAEKRAEPIQLLLTDVVMPGTSGRALADKFLSAHPETKVLFMSGYTDNAIAHRGILDPGTHFIEKPFTPDGLIRKIREILQ